MTSPNGVTRASSPAAYNAGMATVVAPISADSIAAAYLPSRYHYWYARSKIATDPLYAQVKSILASKPAPLLDIGCGIGLLALYLHRSGVELNYRGIDIDTDKIDIAIEAAQTLGLRNAQFEFCDLAQSFPLHEGSVALLDVLQYLDTDVRDVVLERAARCIGTGGQLIIRAGLDDGSWRASFTRFTDRAQHTLRWMKTPPRSQPTREAIADLLTRHGFSGEFRPLWGNTPFNNWLVIASR
ncbi:MAG TPA: class I SAM-dependent methyltransferase [Povalibacter sp.]|jgi:SAM-dependent methyltransferase